MNSVTNSPVVKTVISDDINLDLQMIKPLAPCRIEHHLRQCLVTKQLAYQITAYLSAKEIGPDFVAAQSTSPRLADEFGAGQRVPVQVIEDLLDHMVYGSFCTIFVCKMPFNEIELFKVSDNIVDLMCLS